VVSVAEAASAQAQLDLSATLPGGAEGSCCKLQGLETAELSIGVQNSPSLCSRRLRRCWVDPKPWEWSMPERLIELFTALREEVHPLPPTTHKCLFDQTSPNPLPPPMACDSYD